MAGLQSVASIVRQISPASRTTVAAPLLHLACVIPGCDLARSASNPRSTPIAIAAPTVCATQNPATPAGAMPANVSVSDRANVTAGLANEVDAVNQYAAVM
jgi:hypothetical protein